MPNRGEYADTVRKRLEAKRREETDTVRMPLQPRVPDAGAGNCNAGPNVPIRPKTPRAVGGLGLVRPVVETRGDTPRGSVGDTANGPVSAVAAVNPQGMAGSAKPEAAGVIRSAFRAWKAKRNYKREERRKMGAPAEPIHRSTTTQNVAAGGIISASTLFGLIAFVRSAYPDVLPWAAEQDNTVVVFATTVVTPIISRVIASFRKP